MCLILFANAAHPDFPLVLAANRDEFYARPARPMRRWADRPLLVAGQDAEAGGTWMGMRLDGRFAALTNIRDPARALPPDAPSRGQLVLDALEAPDPETFVEKLDAGAYAGFNLLAGRWDAAGGLALFAAHNAHPESPRRVEPGIHGLSNATLDVGWPKVAGGREALRGVVESLEIGCEAEALARLFTLLSDEARASDADLPRTGVPLEWERRLSARFITSPAYGTRAQTALLLRRDGRVFVSERTVAPGDTACAERACRFDLAAR